MARSVDMSNLFAEELGRPAPAMARDTRPAAPILVQGRIPCAGVPQRVGRLTIGEHTLENAIQERSPARMRRDGLDHFTLQLILEGEVRITAQGHERRALTGEILLLDMTQTLRTESLAARVVTFVMARDFVEAVAPMAADMHGAVLSDPKAGLLADMMMSLSRRTRQMTGEEIAAAGDAFGEVLALALSTGHVSRKALPGEDALDRVRRLVDLHLAEKTLTPDMVAEMAGLSRSRLYEIFKPLGGVSRFIQERRAARLAAHLSRSFETRSVAELSYAAGFATESHASRVFRDLFGLPPGQYRRQMATRRRGDVPFDAELKSAPPAQWAGAFA